MEQDIYAYIVTGWNRQVERENRALSIREYYAALMNVYEHLYRWVQSIATDDQDNLAREWGELHPGTPNPLFVDAASPEGDGQWPALVAALRESIRRSAPWFAESRDIVATAA